MAQENLKSFLTGVRHSVGRKMAGSSHTLPLVKSKPGSSLEAGKKQSGVLLEYACDVTEVFPYSSFGLLMVLLKGTRYIHGLYTDSVRKIKESVSILIESLKGDWQKNMFIGLIINR